MGKWKKWLVIGGTFAAVLVPGWMLSGCAIPVPAHTEVVEYRKEVQWDDTLWTICENVATDDTDIRLLVWQAQHENHIKDPTKLQPGTEIIIHVPKEVRR